MDELFGCADEVEDAATVARHERMVLASRIKQRKTHAMGTIYTSRIQNSSLNQDAVCPHTWQ